jgi:hypothetical protein
LSAKDRFRSESSYSEEIRKIDKKIKRLTHELIDFYIEKKRKAREERKLKQKEKKEDNHTDINSIDVYLIFSLRPLINFYIKRKF